MPELIEAERRRDPGIAAILEALGANTTVETVPIPIDCTDGFLRRFLCAPGTHARSGGAARAIELGLCAGGR
ncbi:MAG: hypothetical protein WDM79_01905 [Terricaulis sp.]